MLIRYHKVLAEIARLDHRVEVPMGRADDAHVQVNDSFSPTLRTSPLSRSPQQLGLHRLGQFADLVQKQRLPVGHLEKPHAVLVRAR